MCVYVDEPWHEGVSWKGTAACRDCGRHGPVFVTELFEGGEEESINWTNAQTAFEMLLNDGVPDWQGYWLDRGGEVNRAATTRDRRYPWRSATPSFFGPSEWEEIIDSIAQELSYRMPVEPGGLEIVCARCLEAKRWLSEWCHSYMFERYRADIIDHWDENEIATTVPFLRLVAAARRSWVIHGRLLEVAEVRALVDASLARLRSDVAKVSEVSA